MQVNCLRQELLIECKLGFNFHDMLALGPPNPDQMRPQIFKAYSQRNSSVIPNFIISQTLCMESPANIAEALNV